MEIVGPVLGRAVSPGTRNAPTLPSFPLLPLPSHLFHPHPTPSPPPAPPSIHFPDNLHLLHSISPSPFHPSHCIVPLLFMFLFVLSSFSSLLPSGCLDHGVFLATFPHVIIRISCKSHKTSENQAMARLNNWDFHFLFP